MDFTALKTAITNAIKLNGNEEITGDILQGVLLSMVTTLGDSAINDLVTAISNEVTARQNGDSTLNGYITALQGAVNSINTKLAEGCVYVGIATTSTNPSTPSGKVFYIAVAAGTYTNFLDSSLQPLVLTQGINILKYNGTSWSVEQVWGVDDEPIAGSNNLVKSGGTYRSYMVPLIEMSNEITTFPKDYYSIRTDGTFGDNTELIHGVLPVNAGEKYILEEYELAINASKYAFCTSDSCSAGGNIPLLQNTSVIEIPRESSVVITIPDGCSYLLFSCEPYYSLKIYKYCDRVHGDEYPILGSNKFLKSNGAASLLVDIKGFGTNPSSAGASAVGEVWYNTDLKLLKRLTALPNTSVTIPYLSGAIYKHNNELYIWNGSDLVNIGDFANLDLAGYQYVSGVVSEQTGLWVVTTSGIGSAIIPVKSGEIYIIEGNTNKPSYFCLTSEIPTTAGQFIKVVNGQQGRVQANDSMNVVVPSDNGTYYLLIDIPPMGHANLQKPKSVYRVNAVVKETIEFEINGGIYQKRFVNTDFSWQIGYKVDSIDGSVVTDANCALSTLRPIKKGVKYVVTTDLYNVDTFFFKNDGTYLGRIHNVTTDNKYYVIDTEYQFTTADYFRVVLWSSSAPTPTSDNFVIEELGNQNKENAKAVFSSFNTNQKQLDFKQLKEYFSKWAKVKDIMTVDPQSSWKSDMVPRGLDVVWNPTDSKWYMFYTGFDGTSDRIGLCTSTDLVNWDDYSNNPIIVPSSGAGADHGGCSYPMIYRYNNKWYMYYIGFTATGYEGGVPTICIAESTDLINWTKQGTIISASDFPSEYGVTVCYRASVFEQNGKWYLVTNAGQYAGSEQIYCFESDNPISGWTNCKKLFEAGDYSEWPFLSDPNVVRIGNVLTIITWADDGILLWFTYADEFPNGEWNCYKMTGLPANTRGNAGISRITKVDGDNDEMYFFTATKAKTFLTLYQRV